MPRKPKEILRALDGLPQEFLMEVKAFIESLKKHNDRRHLTGRNGELLAKTQISAIKKWGGTTLKEGFSGREHDVVVYERNGA